jgi:ubiquinone/menaquinone biosynthesis C-methylase UbiE
MKALLSRLEVPRDARILEIGCGNAIGSALLAAGADLVVATDLPHADRQTHSIGMAAPKRLLQRLDIQRCVLAAASVTHLPFASGSFDLALASFVLEHVPDKKQAMGELHRVVKPGGLVVAFVPNFAERLYAPLFFYVYLASRVVARVRDRASHSRAHGEADVPASGGRRSFRQTYPFFPLPNPHGAYRDSVEELHSHFPEQWIRRLTAQGFSLVDRFYLMNLPANIAALVFGEPGMRLYDRLSVVDRRLGASRFGHCLGQYACYVVRRLA